MGGWAKRQEASSSSPADEGEAGADGQVLFLDDIDLGRGGVRLLREITVEDFFLFLVSIILVSVWGQGKVTVAQDGCCGLYLFVFPLRCQSGDK